MANNCGNCSFAHVLNPLAKPEQIELVCRRNPPHPFLIQTRHPLNPDQAVTQVQSMFPPIRTDGLCGEHVVKA